MSNSPASPAPRSIIEVVKELQEVATTIGKDSMVWNTEELNSLAQALLDAVEALETIESKTNLDDADALARKMRIASDALSLLRKPLPPQE